METFAAVLTAVCFWAFFAYLTTGKRLEARKHAGPVLVKVTSKPKSLLRGRIFFGLFAIILFVFWFYLYISSSRGGYPMPSLMFFTGAFNTLQIGWMAVILGFNSQTEFCRHGLVTSKTGGPFSLVPWSHIRYCKWASTPGTLLVQAYSYIFQVKIPPEKVEAVTDALIQHVDTRDSKGETVNLDHMPFEYPDEPEPLKRHNLQFNLKTALLFMVVASSAFAWLGIHLRAGWQEQEALARLEEFGVEVGYGLGFGNNRVQSLDFSKGTGSLTDDDLRYLVAFERLNSLDLSKMPITDAGLAGIEGITTLRSLHLDSTNVSDDGLIYLEPLTRLEWLDISRTKVTDAGLVHLEGLSNLESLSCYSSKVTDEGIQRLKKKLPKLNTY